ncbi:hypothetical protein, partial [Xanthovirga aplysinae]|uniref:hypothetical protein n=1 Tax=Xanthovirga aplysinae TaxID=2529853 RepID=UPI0012BBB2A6
MRTKIYFIIFAIFFACQGSNEKFRNNDEINHSSMDLKDDVEAKVLYSSYTTAENGLVYREEPDLKASVIGKFRYGT